jgi:hypothetical protein
MKTIIPLKNAIASLTASSEVREMIAALREAGVFEIDENLSAATITATHIASGREVFAAIQKSNGGPWIVRTHRKLFAA